MALNKTKLLVGALVALIVALTGLGAAQASATSSTTSHPVIAVVDSGMTSGQLPTNRIAGQYNSVDKSTEVTDGVGHGTEVLRDLLLRLGPNSDTQDRCEECTFLIIKVVDSAGIPSDKSVAEGLDWAVAQGATVINFSVIQYIGSEKSPLVENSLANAISHRIPVVMAAGNQNSTEVSANWLASDTGNAIRVAAVGSGNQLQPDSNHGSWVELGALGRQTSFATPKVTAVVAMVLDQSPGLTPEQVKNVLHYGTVNVPADGKPTANGCTPASIDVAWHCVLNPDGAVRAAGWTPTVTPPPPPPPPAKKAKLVIHKVGKGSISSRPVAVRCEASTGPSCTTSFGWNASITLMAKPAAHQRFIRWEGACHGTKPTCVVKLSRAKTDVTARFTNYK